jgi:hypothetical protein
MKSINQIFIGLFVLIGIAILAAVVIFFLPFGVIALFLYGLYRIGSHWMYTDYDADLQTEEKPKYRIVGNYTVQDDGTAD